MQEEVNVTLTSDKRVPWNKGKLTGPNAGIGTLASPLA
jgi:hypothetical protein